MNVVYSSSDSYIELAAVSIVSLLENCRDIDELNIYVIDNFISNEHKNEVESMVKGYGYSLHFLPSVDVEKLVSVKIDVANLHISSFERLFLPHILPETVKKVIYLDCDTIVRHSLLPLWNMDMYGAWVMAADDCRGKRYRDDIGIDRQSIYINSGVMVIDLDQWRQNNVEEKFIDFIRQYNGSITYFDQGVLNGVFQPIKKVKLLPIKYNAQSVCFYLGYEGLELCRKAVWAYSKEEFDEDIANPVIVHFTSCFYAGTRPWEKKDKHLYRKEFLTYRQLTPWKNCPLRDSEEPPIKKILSKVCRVLPRNVAFRLLSVLHTWLYPFLRKHRKEKIA